MRIELERCVVRDWVPGDVENIAKHANDRDIWLNVRDRFPHPYSVADAEEFVRRVTNSERPESFAIEVGGEAAGGIGIHRGQDIERVSAEIGYWLGRAHWGNGILTEVIAAVTPWAMAEFSLTRVFALPFAHNAASIRVLEKCGYRLEGRLERAAVKDGVVQDMLMYAITDVELRGQPSTAE